MKLSLAKTKDFFKSIKDNHNHTEVLAMLRDHPELANAIVSKMAKGIDNFSALMLAIRFHNFAIAGELVRAGADVNYMDESPHRYYHNPVFFDLLEMMKDIVETKNQDLFEKGMKLWELMETHGLDYSKKSPATNISPPENCIEACIRLIGTKYKDKHRVHHTTRYEPPAPYESTYALSEASRDPEKEKLYERMIRNIVLKAKEDVVNEVDADRYRFYSLDKLPFYEKEGYTDNFSLEATNALVKETYGYELRNYHNLTYIKTMGSGMTRFAGKN